MKKREDGYQIRGFWGVERDLDDADFLGHKNVENSGVSVASVFCKRLYTVNLRISVAQYGNWA